MVKWLVITIIALALFMSVILGLGYLLKNNKQQTSVMVEQMKQEKEDQLVKQIISSAPLPADEISVSGNEIKEDAFTEQNLQIVLENLTCVSDQQCEVVTISSAYCQVAINTIGASVLNKFKQTTKQLIYCYDEKQGDAICQQNLCQLRAR